MSQDGCKNRKKNDSTVEKANVVVKLFEICFIRAQRQKTRFD